MSRDPVKRKAARRSSAAQPVSPDSDRTGTSHDGPADQLREMEAQYRSIFEATTDGLVINDLETGVIVEANPAFCRMHGYTHDEMVGMHPTRHIRQDFHHLFAEYVRTVRRGETFHTRAVDVRKDGTEFDVDVSGRAFAFRGMPSVLGIVRDITERVRAFELLEQRVAERTRELSALLEISRNVTSTLELRPLLDLVLEQLKTVAEYNGAGIVQLAGDELRVIGYRGPIPQAVALQTTFPADSLPVWGSLKRGEPVVIRDVRGDEPLARAYRQAAGERLETLYAYVRCFLAVPMTLKGQVIGALTLEHNSPGYYSNQHLALAMAIAQQAAIAIENARLYERAQEAAVLEERQRLSRELHDSVSQALYSIALGARTARALVDPDAGRLAEPLDFVLAQAARGMAEMRALIFALRPEALEQEGLASALSRQAEAVRARYDLPVELALCAEPEMPLAAKEALYRIAQEALHNVVKHARATGAWVSLEGGEGAVTLEVRDDGAGFEAGGSYPGHLGVRSMRERAERVGGTLEVESRPGEGTRVRVRVPTRSTA